METILTTGTGPVWLFILVLTIFNLAWLAVYFMDDETGREDWGIFEGFYCDLHQDGELSPYWSEHKQGIHRLRIREADGRVNYILPENVYALPEVEGHVFEVEYGL